MIKNLVDFRVNFGLNSENTWKFRKMNLLKLLCKVKFSIENYLKWNCRDFMKNCNFWATVTNFIFFKEKSNEIDWSLTGTKFPFERIKIPFIFQMSAHFYPVDFGHFRRNFFELLVDNASVIFWEIGEKEFGPEWKKKHIFDRKYQKKNSLYWTWSLSSRW